MALQRTTDLNFAHVPVLVSDHSQDDEETHALTKLGMTLKVRALIVPLSSTCQVVLHVLSRVLFHQFGSPSFCPRRVVFHALQMLPGFHRLVHGTPFYSGSFFPLHSLGASQSSLNNCCDSLWIFVVVWLLSLSLAMRALHNPDNLQCGLEPRCQQTTRGMFSA